MTERNVFIMDKIVDELAAGKKISEALVTVYRKRNVVIPYGQKIAMIPTLSLNISVRAHNALMNAGLKTVEEIIDYALAHPGFVGIRSFGRTSGVEVLEAILDFAWDYMSKKERTNFLIDIVEKNQFNIRKELI